MILSRLQGIKCFIDDLNVYFNKRLYKRLRSEDLTPIEIYESEDWQYYRKWWLTDSGEEVFDDYYFMDDFINSYPLDDMDCRVEHGAQQIAFIYDDIVYKICSIDVGRFVNNNIAELPEEFYKLFAWYDNVEYYNNCYIYTQEFVDTTMSGEYSHQDYSRNYILDSTTLYTAIKLQYGKDYCERFCAALRNLCLEEYGSIDTRESNWGYDQDDNVKIFDPFFCNG